MRLTVDRAVEAVVGHSRGLAAAASGNLRAPVEHCPGWDVAELVWHVTEVHWFWRTIAAERLTAPPEQTRRPVRAPDEELIATFLAGADALAAALRSADQSAPCWTWYPPQQDVAFITRHQVQEAAVHHWDAAHAAGAEITIDDDVAVDSVEEFLTCSLADAEDAAGKPPLAAALVLRANDAGLAWTIHQQDDGTLVWQGGGDHPAVAGTASDLLLWLYQRVDLPVAEPQRELVDAFRALSSTD